MGGVIINLQAPFFPSWFRIYVHLPLMRWLELNQIRFNLQLNCEVFFPPKWGCKTNIKLKLLRAIFFLHFLTSVFHNCKTRQLFEHGKYWHLVCSYFQTTPVELELCEYTIQIDWETLSKYEPNFSEILFWNFIYWHFFVLSDLIIRHLLPCYM